MKNIVLAAASLLIAAFIISCNRDKDEPKPDTSASQDYSIADNLFENVSEVTDQAEDNNNGYLDGGKSGAYLGTCVSISFDTVITSLTNIMTIDFGDSGCVGRDQRLRQGKIIVEYAGNYRDSGTTILTSFEGYFVDGYQLLGFRQVKNMGKNSLGQTYFDIEVDGKVVKPSGGEIVYKSNRNRTWTEGENTRIPLIGWLDDVYEISGGTTGLSSTGKNFTATITKPLEVKLICRWITSGTVQLEPQGETARIFDFGDGDCDPNATMSVGGITYDIIMP